MRACVACVRAEQRGSHLQDRVLEAVEMVEQKGNALALEQASSPTAKEGGVGYYRVQMLYLQVCMSEYPGVPSPRGTLAAPSVCASSRSAEPGAVWRGMQRGHRLRIALHGLCL